MKRSIISLLISILLFDHCTDDDFLFLRSDGADMPIHIEGNRNSGVFILYLHGGPGNGTYVWEKFFPGIEKDFAMVFWDQRAAGEAQGNAKPGSLTIQKFIDDTHKVVTLINNLYNNPEIFIMGHSWGGLLGTAYLIQHREGIKGWIEVDGAHNKILGAQLSKQWVMDYAQEQIDAGNDVQYWQAALDWYNSYTGLLTYSSKHYTEYLDKAHAFFYKSEYQFYTINDYFFGRPNGLDLLLNEKYSEKNMEDEIVITDLTPQMYKIQIPALLCWGRHDGTIPYQMAEDAFNALGTPVSEKSIVFFEESAHSPMIEETELFNNTVINFINEYR
jgi:proline iminopeptidase